MKCRRGVRGSKTEARVMSRTLVSKEQALRDAGYMYNFDRMVYVNRVAKKVFSAEFVEDNDETELRKCIDEESNGSEWRFYFNAPPPAAVRRELENVLR
jgi:hypothetical protein